MAQERFVIIGGDAAGMSAAMQIRRTHPEAQILALEKGDTFSYAQCGMPYWIGGAIEKESSLIARTKEKFRDQYQIDARDYHEATRIDVTQRVVHFRDVLSGAEHRAGFDKLLIATGGRAVTPDWPGLDLDGVFVLKNLSDARKIHEYARLADIQDVVVIGGGYIGLEMVEAFRELGKRVVLIDRNPRIAKPWDTEITNRVQAHMEEHGVQLLLEQEVQGMEGAEGRVGVLKTAHGDIPCDLVLIAIGIAPASRLAKDAGIALGYRDAIAVNERMETNVAGIYAAGDVATHYHRVKKRDDYIPLGTTANKQGRIAGKNMAGGEVVFAGIVGTAVIKVFDLCMARTGLNDAEAKELGVKYETVELVTKDHAGYYPDATELMVRLLVEKGTGTLLGGQTLGKQGADKRIDVLATALHQGMTVDALLDLDLAYAPPFNGVWDPIQQTARRVKR